MCKHVAATLYGVGARLDHAPELLFTLRGVDPTEMVETAVEQSARNAKPRRGRALDSDQLLSVFGIDIDVGGAPPAEAPTPTSAKTTRRTDRKRQPARAKAGKRMAAKPLTSNAAAGKSTARRSAAKKKSAASATKKATAKRRTSKTAPATKAKRGTSKTAPATKAKRGTSKTAPAAKAKRGTSKTAPAAKAATRKTARKT